MSEQFWTFMVIISPGIALILAALLQLGFSMIGLGWLVFKQKRELSKFKRQFEREL